MKRFGLLKVFLVLICVCMMLVYFILGADHAAQQVVNSISLCLNVIIPSLFGFMVLSSFIISSGIYRFLLYPFYIIPEKIFRCNRKNVCIFILSLLGGYPVGAKLISEAVADGSMTSEKASRMLAFCYCPSPPFAIFIAGIGLFGSLKIGVLVYVTCVIGCIITGICSSLLSKKSAKTQLRTDNTVHVENALIQSVSSSIKAMGFVCGMIITFHIILGAFEYFRLLTYLSVVFETFGFGNENGVLAVKSIFEIGNVSLMNRLGLVILPYLSFLFSFGGICILMQCAAISNHSISLKRFFIWRIPTAVFSALIMYCLVQFSGDSIETSVYFQEKTSIITWTGMPVVSLCLIFMAIITLKTLKDHQKSN